MIDLTVQQQLIQQNLQLAKANATASARLNRVEEQRSQLITTSTTLRMQVAQLDAQVWAHQQAINNYKEKATRVSAQIQPSTGNIYSSGLTVLPSPPLKITLSDTCQPPMLVTTADHAIGGI
ncbi:hypothetical protein H4R35_004032 [Dimargaris xerosporica]|nr:hypothetical protein H4R35_004032 [Dimargaris xerosporica]